MKKDKLNLFLLIFLFLIIFIGNFQVNVKLDADDVKYKNYSEKNFLEYTTFMYTKQNGRIMPNFMEYIFLKFNLITIWKILNTFMIFLLAYSISRLHKEKPTYADISLNLIFLCLLL